MRQYVPAKFVGLAVALFVSAQVWAASPEHDFLVGVYYYPWHYNDFHGGNYLREHLLPAQIPKLGEYNDRNSGVLAQHFAWSADAGVEFWVASWWGPGSREDVTLRDHVFPHTGLGDLKIAIHYETAGRTNDFTNYSAIGPDFSYLATTYFDDPNYLRIDNKPVVFVYLTRVLSARGTLQSTVTAMRNAAASEGHDLYVVGDHVFGGPPGGPGDMDRLDAVTNYDVYGSTGASGYAGQSSVNSYYSAQAAWRGLAHGAGALFIPAVSPGFNDKGVRAGHPVLSRQLSVFAGFGSLFRAMLQGAKPLTDAGTGHMLMVTSWNEWHEDTQIEPVQAAAATSVDDSGANAFTNGYSYEGYDTRYLDILEEETVVVDGASVYDIVYVDFLLGDDQNAGTGISYPLKTLSAGRNAVKVGGTVLIQTGDTEEIGLFAKAMTLEALGGSVRIGVGGAKSAGSLTAAAKEHLTSQDGSDAVDAESARFEEALRAHLDGSGSASADGHASIVGKYIYERAIPYTRNDGGALVAQADSVLAIRLRSEAAIDPDSIWGPIPRDAGDEATVEWRAVRDGDLRDVWVVFRPRETWYLEDIVTLTVGASTVAGEALDPMTYDFQVESEEERQARTSDPVEPLWQPQADEDFDASKLDPAGESTDTAFVTPLETEVQSPSTNGYWAPPVVIGPERVYDVPQRVWLPIPDGAAREDVRLYYYHTTGDDRGWYPAENVEGWLVPGSYLYLDIEGTTYLGFLVRHAAIVQLGIPAE